MRIKTNRGNYIDLTNIFLMVINFIYYQKIKFYDNYD